MNAPVILTDQPEKLRLRVEDFERLEESGAFADHSKAELIDGDIYIVNAQFAPHGLAKTRLLYALMKRLEEMGSGLEVYSEVSIRVAADSMPEPDLFLAPRQGYGPVPVDGVVLVVEVADSTRRPIWAEGGVVRRRGRSRILGRGCRRSPGGGASGTWSGRLLQASPCAIRGGAHVRHDRGTVPWRGEAG